MVTELRLPAWTERALAVMPFPLLLVATVLEALSPARQSLSEPLPVLLLTALATAGWMATFRRWPDGLAGALAYFAGALILMSTLVVFSEWFALVSWLVTMQTFVLFELRWAFFAAVASTVALAAAGHHDSSFPVLLVLSLLSPMLVAGWRLGREGQLRRELVDELRKTNADNENMRQQLVERARQAGVDEERRRMAREIHDTLAQELAAVVAQLETVLHTPPSEQWRSRVGVSLDLARNGLTEARRSVRALRPTALCDTGLPDALEALVTRWRDRTGVDARFDVDGPRRVVDETAATVLYRAAQEALANVDKHAKAAKVGVVLSFLDETVSLDVRDDGVGFDAESADGFGIAAMRDRVAEVSGDVTVESAPGAGTAICVSVRAPS